MLKDVIDFVISRTNMTRADALREINYAWDEIWNSDDLPDSLFEITLTPANNNALLSLPWYVGKLRGVKQNFGVARNRIELNTPRPYYQDETYAQSPFVWRVLGTSPLVKTITNATTIDLTFTEPVTEVVTATLIGPNDNGSNVREQLVFDVGDTTKRSESRFVDLTSVAKDIITDTDMEVLDANAARLAFVPNSAFDARNTIAQVTDKCFKVCNWCRCFDILYKKATPYLYFDETPVPMQGVLMTKTMEWILLPKDGKKEQTIMHGTKARELLTQFNADERGVAKRMDVGDSPFVTSYSGKL